MNILCILGFHRMDNEKYIRVQYRKGSHRWHKNYLICARCGKLYSSFSIKKREVSDNA